MQYPRHDSAGSAEHVTRPWRQTVPHAADPTTLEMSMVLSGVYYALRSVPGAVLVSIVPAWWLLVQVALRVSRCALILALACCRTSGGSPSSAASWSAASSNPASTCSAWGVGVPGGPAQKVDGGVAEQHVQGPQDPARARRLLPAPERRRLPLRQHLRNLRQLRPRP